MYWLFDNLYILTKIMNQKNGKIVSKKIDMWSRIFWRFSRIWWLGGIVIFLVYCIKTLRKTYTDESDLKVAALDKMTVEELI